MSKYPLPEAVIVSLADRPLAGPLKVELSHALMHGQEELRELTLQPLRGAHVRLIPRAWESTSDVLAITSHLTGLPDFVLDGLRGSDIGAMTSATLDQSWPIRDLPAQWEALARDLDARGVAHEIPAVPRLEGKVELVLLKPVTVGEETTSRLVFDEMTGKMARGVGLNGLELARTPWLIEQLASTTAAVVDRLEGVDLNRALALAQGFLFGIRPRLPISG